MSRTRTLSGRACSRRPDLPSSGHRQMSGGCKLPSQRLGLRPLQRSRPPSPPARTKRGRASPKLRPSLFAAARACAAPKGSAKSPLTRRQQCPCAPHLTGGGKQCQSVVGQSQARAAQVLIGAEQVTPEQARKAAPATARKILAAERRAPAAPRSDGQGGKRRNPSFTPPAATLSD